MYRIRFATALRIAPSVWLLARSRFVVSDYFFFNDTATTEIYTLSYTTLFRSRCDRRPDPRAARVRPLQRLLRHVVLSAPHRHGDVRHRAHPARHSRAAAAGHGRADPGRARAAAPAVRQTPRGIPTRSAAGAG